MSGTLASPISTEASPTVAAPTSREASPTSTVAVPTSTVAASTEASPTGTVAAPTRTDSSSSSSEASPTNTVAAPTNTNIVGDTSTAPLVHTIIASGAVTASGNVTVTGAVHITMPPPAGDAQGVEQWLIERRNGLVIMAITVIGMVAVNINSPIGGNWSSKMSPLPNGTVYEPGQPILEYRNRHYFKNFMMVNFTLGCFGALLAALTEILARRLRGRIGRVIVGFFIILMLMLLGAVIYIFYYDIVVIDKVNMGIGPTVVIILVGVVSLIALFYELWECIVVLWECCHGRWQGTEADPPV